MKNGNVIYDDRFVGSNERRLYDDSDVIPTSKVSEIVNTAVDKALSDYHSKLNFKSKKHPKVSIEKSVLELLKGKKYPGRTARGMAAELGVTTSKIERLLVGGQLLGHEIKVYPRRNSRGEKVYTLKTLFTKNATWKDIFIDAICVRK